MKKNVMFISSTGGHLSELLQLANLFPRYNSCLITENTKSNRKLKKKYKKFMSGKDARTLEDVLKERLDEIDDLVASNKANKKNIEDIFATLRFTFQKLGLVKYDAFNEMGGKLSFSLAMLNERNDGYIINAMHSREGCYTYIKEIIDGNSIIALSEEEKEALEMAMKSKDE